MKSLFRLIASLLVVWTTFMFSPTICRADSCGDAVRLRFRKVSASVEKIKDAISAYRLKNGRAQLSKVMELITEKQADALKNRIPWDEMVKKWSDDVVDRMRTKETYPKVEELIAVMAARSHSFEAKVYDFLLNRGEIRFKVMAHFLERINKGDKLGELGSDRIPTFPKIPLLPLHKISSFVKDVTYGKRFHGLFEDRIRLPGWRPWSVEELDVFMIEVSNTLYRALNPPEFWGPWRKSLLEFSPNFKKSAVMKSFAEKMQSADRLPYREFMQKVSNDVNGSLRPEIADYVRELDQWGYTERFFAKVIKLFKDGKVGTPEYNAEIERMVFAARFWSQPVMLAAHASMWVYGGYEFYERDRKNTEFEKRQKEHPRDFIPKVETPKAIDERVRANELAIQSATEKLLMLRDEQAKNPNLSPAQRQRNEADIAKYEMDIARKTKLLEQNKRQETEIHP